MKLLISVFLLFFSLSANAAWVFPDKTPDVQADKNVLYSEFTAIKADASTLVGFTFSGTGALPCGTAFTLFGKPVEFCLDRYSNSVESISVAVLFMAALISLYIVIS